jgi:hypothetical protein
LLTKDEFFPVDNRLEFKPVTGRFDGEVDRPKFANFDSELDKDEVLNTVFTIPFKFLVRELFGFNYSLFEFIPFYIPLKF